MEAAAPWWSCSEAASEPDAAEVAALQLMWGATGGRQKLWKEAAGWAPPPPRRPDEEEGSPVAEAAQQPRQKGVLRRRGKVVKVELPENGLAGPFPAAHLAQLRQLRVLALFGNALTGTLKPLAALPKSLTHLDVSHNELTGRLSPRFLDALPLLRRLHLEHNQLSGWIPNLVANLACLEHLTLQQNDFEGRAPLELGKLPNLKVLKLHDNDKLTFVDVLALRDKLGPLNFTYPRHLHPPSLPAAANLPPVFLSRPAAQPASAPGSAPGEQLPADAAAAQRPPGPPQPQ